LTAAAFFALTFCSASLVWAQSGDADALHKAAAELYAAGKFSEAIPLAEQELAIREKALGPDHPNGPTLHTRHGSWLSASRPSRRIDVKQNFAFARDGWLFGAGF
jgi:hypothetical protein